MNKTNATSWFEAIHLFIGHRRRTQPICGPVCASVCVCRSMCLAVSVCLCPRPWNHAYATRALGTVQVRVYLSFAHLLRNLRISQQFRLGESGIHHCLIKQNHRYVSIPPHIATPSAHSRHCCGARKLRHKLSIVNAHSCHQQPDNFVSSATRIKLCRGLSDFGRTLPSYEPQLLLALCLALL